MSGVQNKTTSLRLDQRASREPQLLLLLLLLGIYLLDQGAESIQVLEFQRDGVATQSTMAEYEGKLDHNWKMDSLTLCARFQIFFLHGRSTFFRLWDRVDGLPYQLIGGQYMAEI
ncbi:uncharacterized protein [Panulirus ornatus]|uniref:uncharacterized protein n=1 Tax=Panulirus ornatus TaxID=150431 RepID=UPI003A858F82